MRKIDLALVKLRGITGIYIIINHINRKKYVGSSKSIGERLSVHKSRLRGGYHPNTFLQRSWNKYGESAFSFETLEITTELTRVERENYWIRFHNACNDNFGYNYSSEARSSGMDVKVRLKISKTKKGVPMKQSAKDKLRKWHLGTKLSDETKRKIGEKSKLRVGWKHSKSAILKMKKNRSGIPAWNKGLRTKLNQIIKPEPVIMIHDNFIVSNP